MLGACTNHQSHPKCWSGRSVAVNVVHSGLDPHKEGDIDREYDERKEGSKERHQGGDEEDGEMGREGKQPCDKDDCSRDRVDHESASVRLVDKLAANFSRIGIALYGISTARFDERTA